MAINTRVSGKALSSLDFPRIFLINRWQRRGKDLGVLVHGTLDFYLYPNDHSQEPSNHRAVQ
jgi:hypothetical protein